ncbi:MAG: uroporphyrinogen-III synthase [Pseudomonadota bacterium]
MPPALRPVLVTRPAERAHAEIEALGARGVPAIAAPLTRIARTDPPPSVPHGADAIIFTSAEAVAVMALQAAAKALPAYCVGAQTRAAAMAAGFAPVSGEAAADVTALIPQLIAAAQRRFFHPAGRHVAGDLAGALSAIGKTVERRTAYEAVACPLPGNAIVALKAGALSAAGFWSPRNATLFAEAATPHWHLDTTVAVTISENAARPLAALRFAHVSVAAHPTGEAMRDLLVHSAINDRPGTGR